MIVCVVTGHLMYRYVSVSSLAKSIYFFVYLFHMPVFIFVSGMFAKNIVAKKQYDKIASYLILYLVMKFVQAFAVSLTGKNLSFHIFWESGPGWYALAIFVYLCFIMIAQKLDPRYLMFLAVFAGCIAGYDNHLGDHFASLRICVFLPFFISGYILNMNKVQHFLKLKRVQLFALFILIITIALIATRIDSIFWFIKMARGKFTYSNMDLKDISGALFRLIYYIIAAATGLSVMSLIPTAKNIFSMLGQHTISVFAWHYSLIILLFDVLHGADYIKILWPIHYVYAVILIGCLIIIFLSGTPIYKLTNLIVQPKLKKE